MCPKTFVCEYVPMSYQMTRIKFYVVYLFIFEVAGQAWMVAKKACLWKLDLFRQVTQLTDPVIHAAIGCDL